MGNVMKKLDYTLDFKLPLYIVLTAFVVVILMLQVAFYDIVRFEVEVFYQDISAGPFPLAKILLPSVFNILMSGFILSMVFMIANCYPAIELHEKGLILTNALGQRDFVGWLDMTRILRVQNQRTFTRRRLPGLMIGASHLGWPYLFAGRLLWLGRRGFVISGAIENYNELTVIIRKQRPELYSDYYPRQQ